ncbi:hypothetical protein [Chromobacterium sphagni]|uniref:YqjK-like protein n=1 Tax=Chromobacterium sphagni TaxID=1903179 RepID=A0ABX3CG50_9NEIS|nr:hypothetical protein [Chromobacterium sphagni]OHX21042.1 hypothetical protein BI344_00345 [Chromobacterium sphagni]
MSPQDRALRKQLLLMKGEALRLKLRLEKERLCQPWQAAGASVGLLAENRQLQRWLSLLEDWIPSARLRRLLKAGGSGWLLWRLARRWLRR